MEKKTKEWIPDRLFLLNTYLNVVNTVIRGLALGLIQNVVSVTLFSTQAVF